MADLFADLRRRLAPVSLRVWPSLSNPAWNSAGAARIFSPPLMISLAPARIARKIAPESPPLLKEAFLVNGLGEIPSSPVTGLYTYRDMEDIARHGADWRATRLGRWLAASVAAGRPPLVRGTLITDEAGIEAYYRGYLQMFESMREVGYRYEGSDHMCFGIAAGGEVLLVRRGTHRLAAAQILGLAGVTGRVTHLDRRFAEQAQRRFAALPLVEAIRRAVAEAAAA